jgi:hypothetical protein
MLASVLYVLSCVVSMFSTSGMFHLTHAAWYLFRIFTVDPQRIEYSFEDSDLKVPTHVSDVFVFAVISVSQIPFEAGSLGSFVWIPLAVHLVMGYPTSVWYAAIVSAFFCMAVSECFEILFVCTHLLWGAYRGSYKRWSLFAAAVAHLCFAWTQWDFDWISVASGLLAAEAKYLMMYDPYTAVEALSYLSIAGVWSPLGSSGWIWTLIPYVSNFTLFGWSKRWRYTDKVWYDADVCIFISALLVAFGVSRL